MSRISSSLALVLALSISGRAHAAPTRDQCFDSYERAQKEQKQGKLQDARKDYKTCSNDACPKLVVKDCSAALEKLASMQPSVSLGPGNGSGVRVSIDGAAAVDLPSSAVELDPGDHVFRFEASDGRSSEKHVTLDQGQRDVSVVPDFAEAPKSAETTGPAPAPAPQPEAKGKKPGAAVFVLGGVALVGVAGFVGFGLAGRSKQNDLDACKPDCAADDVHDMRKKYLFADISLGVALVAGGLGAYLYLSHDKTTERATWVRPSAGPQSASLELGTRF